MGGHLVTMSNAAENSFVYSQWSSGWIGYYQDKTGDFYSEPNAGWRWTEIYPTTGQQNDWDVKASGYTSGSTLTDIKNSKNITLYNSPAFTNSAGRYLTFNGSNNYAMTPDLTSEFGSSKVITIQMWVYPTGNGVILDELGVASTSSGWHESVFEITGGNTLNVGLWNGTGITKVTSSITLNTWHLIGLTYNGTTLTAYKDGVSVGTQTFTRSAPHTDGGAGEVFAVGLADVTNMGSGAYGAFRYGGLQVYNTSLSADEMNRAYMATAYRFGVYPYSNWNGGEPNNSGGEDYIQFVGSGLWNDLPNTYSYQYVLEFDYIVTTGPWVLDTTVYTNSSGYYSISRTTNPSIEWYLELSALTMPSLTSTDAQSPLQVSLGLSSINAKKYYLQDVNNDGRINVTDSYYIYAKLNGKFTTWNTSLPNYRIFTPTQWTTINSSTSDLRGTYPGVQTYTVTSPVSGGTANFYITRTGFGN